MTDTTITSLPDAATLTGSEFFVLDQGSTTARISLSNLAAFLGGGSVSAQNVYLVSPSGTPYTSVAAAITAINAGTAPTLANPATIIVYPGTYTVSTPMVVPQYTNIVGVVNKTWASARFQNNSGDVFQLSGFNTIQGLTCIQGTTRGTYFINGGNNTDIGVYDCAMFGSGAGQNQGFYRSSGSGWTRVTIQDSIVNSYQSGTTLTPGTVPVGATVDTMVLLENTTSARFCDTWLRNNFFDNYQVGSGVNNFAFAVLAIGVQDVRVETGNTLRGGAINHFIACYLAAGNASGAQLEFRGGNYTGGNTIGLVAESGTTIICLNSDAANSTTGAGTIVNHNSYTGASYNSLPI